MELIDILRFQLYLHTPVCDDEPDEPQEDQTDDDYEAWANGDDLW